MFEEDKSNLKKYAQQVSVAGERLRARCARGGLDEEGAARSDRITALLNWVTVRVINEAAKNSCVSEEDVAGVLGVAAYIATSAEHDNPLLFEDELLSEVEKENVPHWQWGEDYLPSPLLVVEIVEKLHEEIAAIAEDLDVHQAAIFAIQFAISSWFGGWISLGEIEKDEMMEQLEFVQETISMSWDVATASTG